VKRAFELREGVYLVEGTEFASICDTNSGNVYSINRRAKDIALRRREDPSFLRRLVEMDLVAEPEASQAVEEPSELTTRHDISLDFIWFEIISSDCNERCTHCYADSMPPSYRTAMGFVPLESLARARPNEANARLSFDRWTDLIREGAALGCKNCQFIGGEPFLYKASSGAAVLDLAETARLEGYELIEIFTNATLLTASKIRRIKELRLNIAVSLYSIKAEIHDAITRTPGSFEKTRQALEALKRADIPTRVEVTLMRTNQETVEETLRWIETAGFRHKSPDVLRPKGRGDNPELIPDSEFVVEYGLMTEPNFRADRDFLIRSISGHNCLAGKITITESGDILPCIFSRNQVMGNVRSRRLQDVLGSSQLKMIWHSTKDNVLVCQDCEYRYVCFDCRPISEAMADGKADYLRAPYPRCTYNPYTGEWAKGLWRMNDDGEPLYDRSVGPCIQRTIKDGTKAKVTPEWGH
jgi:radical SAM protein with 4Fe4S-binding SPASM domain